MMKIKNILLGGLIFNILLSCGDCDFFAESYRKIEFNLILNELPCYCRAYSIKGINPITGFNEKHFDDGGFLGIRFRKLISIGDTLVKKQGELKVYIHKKDTVLIYRMKCDGKTYE